MDHFFFFSYNCQNWEKIGENKIGCLVVWCHEQDKYWALIMTTETIFIFKIKFIQILFHLFLLMEYVKQHKHVPKCPRDNSYVLLSMFWSLDHKLQRILGRQKRYNCIFTIFTSTKPMSYIFSFQPTRLFWWKNPNNQSINK